MVSYLSSLVLLPCLVLVCQGAPAEDLIISLPGADFDISFAQYSGYLTSSTLGKHLFYWFVESQRDPATDPVLLWLNGGPGCSSLLALLYENGPFHIDHDGEKVLQNPYSWNVNASMIFLEAPSCVGFSYGDDDNCTHSDNSVSLANYEALQDFFTNKFPEYRANDFYITGESYGGVYVPTLSERVVQGMDDYQLTFKGFAVGNGIISYEANDNSLMWYAYHLGMLGAQRWDNLVKACCEGGVPTQEGCHFHYPDQLPCITQVIEANMVMFSGDFNYYSYWNECARLGNSSTIQGYSPMDADLDNLYIDLKKKAGITKSPRSSPPCIDTANIAKYLNRPEVREALHVPSEVQTWELCNDEIPGVYTRQHNEMSAQFEVVLDAGGKILVFNGDWDVSVNHLGNRWFVEGLGLTETKPYGEWYYDGQVAGFYKQFAYLDYVQVKAAGHTAPSDQPGATLKMIYDWIEGRPY